MSVSPLLQAALDEMYVAGTIDAEAAATSAVFGCFLNLPPDLAQLGTAMRNEIINRVCQSIQTAALTRIGAQRHAMVSQRYMELPRDDAGTGEFLRQ